MGCYLSKPPGKESHNGNALQEGPQPGAEIGLPQPYQDVSSERVLGQQMAITDMLITINSPDRSIKTITSPSMNATSPLSLMRNFYRVS
jgi:hypothetical protein